MVYYQAFSVAGLVNSTVFDDGLESTEKEPKTLLSIIAQVSKYVGNYVEAWIGKGKVLEIPDSVVDTTEPSETANVQKSGNRLSEIPVGVELAVGERFKVAIRCGAAAGDIVGCYIYEISGK